jgi:hypothetical protein
MFQKDLEFQKNRQKPQTQTAFLCLHCTQEQVPSLVPSEKVHYKTPVTGSGDSQPH